MSLLRVKAKLKNGSKFAFIAFTTVMLNGEFLFGVGTTEIKTISQI